MRDKLSLLIVFGLLCIQLNGKTQKFTWQYDNADWEMQINLNRQTFDWFAERNHNKKLGCFVADPYDDEFFANLAIKLQKYIAEMQLPNDETPYLMIAFVQSLPYQTDEKLIGAEEYRQYPYEMLYRGCGDCEDSSILTAALLKAMHYDVVFLKFPQHVAIGIWSSQAQGKWYVKNQRRYYYLETTNTGWEIGEVPDSYQHIQPEIIFLNPEVDVSMSLDCNVRYNQHSVSMTYHIEIENTGSEHVDNLSLVTYVLKDNCFILAQDSVPFSSTFHIDEKVSIKNTVRFPNPHSLINVSSRVIQNYNQIAEILSDPIDLR